MSQARAFHMRHTGPSAGPSSFTEVFLIHRAGAHADGASREPGVSQRGGGPDVKYGVPSGAGVDTGLGVGQAANGVAAHAAGPAAG